MIRIAYSLAGLALLIQLTACGGGSGSGNDSNDALDAYQVGGTVTGLVNGILRLQINGGDDLTLESDRDFHFATPVQDGSAYEVTIASQPSGQVCTLNNANGVVSGADVNNLTISCVGETDDTSDLEYYRIGGSITGQSGPGSVTVQLNSEEFQRLNGARTTFQFDTELPDNSYYEVTILSEPAGQRCTINNASGIVAGADVNNLSITCDTVFSLGGTVSGLTESGLVLQNSGGDDLAVAEDGRFVFATAVVEGTGYEVSILSHPGNQRCRIVNGSGMIAGSAIVNVSVLCPSTEFLPLVSASSPKVVTLTWSDQGVDHYKLLKNPDGISGYTQLGSDLTDTQVHDEIAVHLTDWMNASYIVQACNTDGECVDSPPVTPVPAMLGAIGYFKASNTSRFDSFGRSVALSADGNTMAIGAPGKDTGTVFLFVKEGLSWRQEAYIQSSNGDREDAFGGIVKLSSNGDVLAVGAKFEDSAATYIDGDLTNNLAEDSGAVYIFERTAGSWIQQAYIKAHNTGQDDRFGGDIALSNDGMTLAVTARLEDSSMGGINPSRSDNNSPQSGAAYVYARTDQNWRLQAYIKASSTDEDDFFGSTIALSGDGDTLAVCAGGEDSLATGINGDQTDNSGDFTGAVYLYSRSGGRWTQQAYIKASNADSGDFFGVSLALSRNGNRLAVGASGEASTATGVNGDQSDNTAPRSGATYLFDRNGTDWQQRDYIKPSNTDELDHFGGSIALSADGNLLVVMARSEGSEAVGIGGDQGNDPVGGRSGAAYLFMNRSNIWQQQAYIKPPVDRTSFHDELAISDDGVTLVVGVPSEDSSATGINGDRTDNSAISAGAVYLY